jgi:hypothetical protein
MTDKRRLHHLWTRIRPLSPWYFLALSLISSCMFIYAMRQNNLTMISLRDKVFAADEANTDVEQPLRELREYVYAHMNTNLSSGTNIKPPIQLKYRYDRLVSAEKERVAAINAKIYNDAQVYCEQQNPTGFSGRGRVPCIEDYVSTHGTKEQPILDATYKFDFASPRWAPDLAGWSLVAATVFFILFVVRYALERLIKAELHNHL